MTQIGRLREILSGDVSSKVFLVDAASFSGSDVAEIEHFRVVEQ